MQPSSGRYAGLKKALGPRRALDRARSSTTPSGLAPGSAEPGAPERYAAEQPLELADGARRVAYRQRRFLPQGASMPTAREVTVVEGDRLDLIAWRTLGDPLEYWRIADANDAMDPSTLTAAPGRRLKVPLPEAGTGWTPPEQEPTFE